MEEQEHLEGIGEPRNDMEAAAPSLPRVAAEAECAEAAAEPELSFVERDARDFAAKYPAFDSHAMAKLESNAEFLRFCGSRFGKEPLAELYGAFCALVAGVEQAAIARAANRRARSTGGGTAGGSILSPMQKAALDAWNAEHPEMAMTAKEFLKR